MLLENRQRLWVPLASLLIVAVMFLPVMWLARRDEIDPAGFGLGVSVMLLSMAWLAASAWKAPFEMKLEEHVIRVRRLTRTSTHPPSAVVRWSVAHPQTAPGRTPEPADQNGLLILKLADGTRFRAEVTAEQSRELTRYLSPETRA